MISPFSILGDLKQFPDIYPLLSELKDTIIEEKAIALSIEKQVFAPSKEENIQIHPIMAFSETEGRRTLSNLPSRFILRGEGVERL